MDWYSIGITAFVCVLVLGVIMGCGSNRKIIVFRDYDDLGLTFMVPVSFFLILYLFQFLGADPRFGMVLGGVVALGLFVMLAKNTFIDNERILWKTLLSLITKTPFSIIWVLNLLQVLNPSGRGAQRSQNRGQALIILTLLTPILGLLVVDRSGSYFNPKKWLHGRRVGGGVRNHL